MAIKIASLLLALFAACSCLDGGFGSAGDLSGIDPGFRLGLTSPSRDDPVPKIEPLALTRRGFNTIGARRRNFNPDPRRPGPVNLPITRIRVRVRAGPGGYIPTNIPPLFPRPGGYDPGNLSGGVRYPIGITHCERGILPPCRIQHPFVPWPNYIPENIRSPSRYPFNPWWNQRIGSGVNGPITWVPGPRQGDIIGPGGPTPRQPNQRTPDFNQVNKSRDDNDNEKDLPEGTVVVTVAAVNETDKGSVHANVTFSIVPKLGDNKETLNLVTKQHLNAAQSILDEIFNKHKSEELQLPTHKNGFEAINDFYIPDRV